MRTILLLILPIIFLIFIVLAFLACGDGGERHFITDKAYRAQVHEDFQARKELAKGREAELFAVFEREDLTLAQREALEFLYAYMPLCDLSEYGGDYFLRQVDGAFRARETFHWGKTVPEEIFRHFVLVHRTNNEYMDDARDVFFEELRDRVKDLSMYDAALEVNHWCHEKVTYRATDGRTSAPLAVVRTSWGRCGEQSVFTTTAMRAVGIPARQTYVPRWSHTDSNHAWVEVWIDGQWYYLGACEPEPELNVGWFDGPVQRAMMTHTTVYGRYHGPEEQSVTTSLYSIINTLPVYAKVRRAEVRVVDEAGAPVEDARVQFKVYNWGDLHPIVTLRTDTDGRASTGTGYGDLMVWADKGDRYGYVKSGPEDQLVTLVLSRQPGEVYGSNFVMSPPAEQPFNELPAEKIAANAVRLAHNDSVRNAYMATFADEAYAHRVAAQAGLDAGQTWHYLHTAQGNWQEIERFIRDRGADAFTLLSTLTEKDIRDTSAETLESHIRRYAGRRLSNEQLRYIFSPRIGTELITPAWAFFADGEPQPTTGAEAAEYVARRITVSDVDNFYNTRLTPMGVHTLAVSDRPSRDIYFVAMCRTLGIEARLDPATRTPQYRNGAQWVNVDFGAETSSVVPPRGRIVLRSYPDNIITPGYGNHFAIAVFRDGDFHTLGLGSEFEGSGGGFPATIPLEEGYYRLLVASRANDGSATIDARYFNIAGGDTHTMTVKLPEVEGKLFVKGVVDMNSIIFTDDGQKTTLKQLGRGRGVVLIFADPDKEPTKHILQEMPRHREALEEWGGAVVFMVPDDKRSEAFDARLFGGLPAQTVWATDEGRELLDQTAAAIRTTFRNNFPLVAYLTSNGGVIYSSEGYRLGIVEDVVRTIRLEEQTMR
ncbi:MAG: transglutaminase-like domain-containing protein [Rikenellaceae bacterium]|nr:transglutaminase-like domain-containing protein [Rikenellaceae bacterium]MCL2692115.1 transglutaminase-like domain-containing protein [Rikenellaceae bacterium]